MPCASCSSPRTGSSSGVRRRSIVSPTNSCCTSAGRFGVKDERLLAEQAQLFEEAVGADLAAMTEEIEQLPGKSWPAKGQNKRKLLPPERRRIESHQEPAFTL